jgi:alpha-L-fucosidase 2
MLMQTDGKRIDLLPAWPKDWTADFKLHAPYQTTVEGHVSDGKIVHLRVTPKSRAKDVFIAGTSSRADSQ